MTPALTSSSLNLPIAARAFSSGSAPASDSFVAFTITMKRIVILLVRGFRPTSNQATSEPARIDTAARASSAPRPCPDGRTRDLPPVLLVAPGLLPVAYGALGWCTTVIRRLATLGGASGDEKAALVSATDRRGTRAVRAWRADLDGRDPDPRRGRDRDHRDPRSARAGAGPARFGAGVLALAGAFALGAVLLVVGARPMARENQTPWPPLTFGARLAQAEPTPDLLGPDSVERAPVVVVTGDCLTLDAAPVNDADTLYEKLDWLRINSLRLNSIEVGRRVVLVVDAATRMSRLRAVLQAALQPSVTGRCSRSRRRPRSCARPWAGCSASTPAAPPPSSSTRTARTTTRIKSRGGALERRREARRRTSPPTTPSRAGWWSSGAPGSRSSSRSAPRAVSYGVRRARLSAPSRPSQPTTTSGPRRTMS